MIMRLGVCAPAIEEISEQTGASYGKLVHATIAEFLAAHGHLVMTNSKEILDLVKLATASPTIGPGARQIWSVLIQEMRKQGRIQVLHPGSPRSLAEVSTVEQLTEAWPDNEAPVVAMVPDTLLQRIFPAVSGQVTDPGTGVIFTNPAEFLDTAPVQELRGLLNESRLVFGATRKSYWDQVLGPLANAAKEVTIYDRFLFSELMRRSQMLPNPTEPIESLVWILTMLDRQCTDGLVVRLLTATANPPQSGLAQHPQSAEAAAQLLKAAWVRPPTGSVAQVEIIAGPWKQDGKLMPHDRHIRFGENRAVAIPAGLDRLKTPAVEDAAGMAWTYHWKGPAVGPLIASENQLRSGRLTRQVAL